MPPGLHAALLLLLLLSTAAATAWPLARRSLSQTNTSSQSLTRQASATDPYSPNPGPNLSSPTGAVNMTQIVEDVQRALREPVAEVVTLNAEFSAGGSSISVGDVYSAGTLAVQFKFGPCMGIQLHHHSTTELMQAVVGSLQVSIISSANNLTANNITAGQALVIPAGWPHYYLNAWCDTALLVATWPSGTTTTFDLAVLSAIPSSLFGGLFAATGTAPAPKPGFPSITDVECLRRCAANRRSAGPAQGG